MAFGGGSAFGGRSTRRPAATAPCPCGGGTFGTCCGRLLAGRPAPTAEALMRSRFTAFAVGDRLHLVESWHPSTRPERLDLDPSMNWLSLMIDDVSAGAQGDEHGTVSFRARWRSGDEEGTLSERSRFVRQRNRWWYVDGDVTENAAADPST